MDKRFGGAGAKDCPGSDVCEELKKTPEWVRAEQARTKFGRRATGGGCEKCPRKSDPPHSSDLPAEREAVARVYQLIIERRAHYRRPLEELDPLDWELIKLWEEREQLNRDAAAGDLAALRDFVEAYLRARAGRSEGGAEG